MSLMKQVKKWWEVLAIRIAMKDANTACACITYQLELPKVIKNMASSENEVD